MIHLEGTTGCLKKKCDLFYDPYLQQIKHKYAEYIFHLNGGIHSSVMSMKKCLYDIREPRYEKIKIVYQSLDKLDIGHYKVLKFHVPYPFANFWLHQVVQIWA